MLNLKKNIQKQTNTNLDPEYIQELQRKIPELKKESTRMQDAIDSLEETFRKFSILNVPFEYRSYTRGTLSILSNDFNATWESYKKQLYNVWRGEYKGQRVIAPGLDTTLYVVIHLIFATLAILNIITKFSKSIGIGVVMAVPILYVIMELLCGAVSIHYYVIRPNLINRKRLKVELRKLKVKKAAVESEISTYQGLIDAYKLSTLSPMHEYSSVKGKTIAQLSAILNEAKDIANNNRGSYWGEQYLKVLSKCAELLEIAEGNATIVTEISKIYTIYLIDINSLLSKLEGIDNNQLLEMLSNFEGYVDRKIGKFKELNRMSIGNDINALNNAFLED